MASRRRLQVIDENKDFHLDVDEFIRKDCAIVGKDYHLVAILGPQSSGKSTLLNGIFGTNFDVMNESSRSQTTHGIWVSKSVHGQVLVLDVEGTDGRERADDQDFERKGALFSLAVSEVLIVNMWEHSVGLYHGANMSLLKTIMDVHLQLFKDDQSVAGTTIMFVIRDYLGQTPVENLKNTIVADLNNIWSSLKKPETFEGKSIDEVFRFEFAFLPHKVLKPADFEETCRELSKRFEDPEDTIFDRETSPKIVPADGLSIYMQSIWDKISNNKDLDLPNQQELLAQYRCDELAQQAFSNMLASSSEFCETIRNNGSEYVDFAFEYFQAKNGCIEEFSASAFRYSSTIFEKKLLELLNRVEEHFFPLAVIYIQNIQKIALDNLGKAIKKIEDTDAETFAQALKNAIAKAKEEFTADYENISSLCENWDISRIDSQFQASLKDCQTSHSRLRFGKAKDAAIEKVSSGIEEFFADLETLSKSESVIPKLLEKVEETLAESKESLSHTAKVLLESEDGELMVDAEQALRLKISQVLSRNLSESNIKTISRKRFDAIFRYDSNGHPRVWAASDNVATIFTEAKAHALLFLDELDNIGADHHLVPASLKDSEKIGRIRELVSHELEIVYVDTKRMLISQSTTIPPWIYVLLVVLGWNEFVALISSPFYLLLFILALTIYVVVSTLGLQPMIKSWIAGILRDYYKLVDTYRAGPEPKSDKKD